MFCSSTTYLDRLDLLQPDHVAKARERGYVCTPRRFSQPPLPQRAPSLACMAGIWSSGGCCVPTASIASTVPTSRRSEPYYTPLSQAPFSPHPATNLTPLLPRPQPLGRTVVAQFTTGMRFLAASLTAVGLGDEQAREPSFSRRQTSPSLSPPPLSPTQAREPSSRLLLALMDMYSELGDRVALQYGGSEAHKKVPLPPVVLPPGPLSSLPSSLPCDPCRAYMYISPCRRETSPTLSPPSEPPISPLPSHDLHLHNSRCPGLQGPTPRGATARQSSRSCSRRSSGTTPMPSPTWSSRYDACPPPPRDPAFKPGPEHHWYFHMQWSHHATSPARHTPHPVDCVASPCVRTR